MYASSMFLGDTRETSLTVYTYVNEEMQRRRSGPNAGPGFGEGLDAYNWSRGGNRRFFFADVENYVVYLDHSIAQTECASVHMARDVDGRLLVRGTNALQQELCRKLGRASSAPCSIPVRKEVSLGRDQITVGTLLMAAGVSLEGRSGSERGRSLRERGMSLRVVVMYYNFLPWWGTTALRYDYLVSVMHNQQVYIRGSNKDLTSTSRFVRFMFGVRITAVLNGELARFSASEACLRLASFVSLLAILRYCLKFVATKLTPIGRYHDASIVEEAPEFSYVSVMELESLPKEDIDHMLESRRLPRGGSPEQRVMRLLEDGWAPTQSIPARGEMLSSMSSWPPRIPSRAPGAGDASLHTVGNGPL